MRKLRRRREKLDLLYGKTTEMTVLLGLLIASIGTDMPIDTRYPEATTVFHSMFDEASDVNYDGWPDDWRRRSGPGYPHYIVIKIDTEPSPAAERCLRIDLDGRGAVAYSPPIKVSHLFSYVLEVYIKTEGLKYDRAYCSVTLRDKETHRLERVFSEKVYETKGWRKIRLGPFEPSGRDVHDAIVGLHVEPQSRQDLRGTVMFTDVWLGRLPRMALLSNKPYHFFNTSDEIAIECTASGFLTKNPEITFRLEDALGNELERWTEKLFTRATAVRQAISLDAFSDEPAGLIGDVTWRPEKIPGPGFYRVHAEMKGRETLVHRRQLDLVVLDPRHSPSGGVFGWTLAEGGEPLPLPQLSQLLGQAGINWVKFPLWYEDDGTGEVVDRLISFGERLSAQEIELIGLLNHPPASLRDRFGDSKSVTTAAIFSPDPQVWYPSLEPVMTRLGIRVRWWQLGDDLDTSFVDYPRRVEKIRQIKSELDRIGQDVNLGVGWQWLCELPSTDDGQAPPWRALALSADPTLTERELLNYLDATQDARAQRWVVLRPLAKSDYPTDVRAEDLVRRMIAAKTHRADAVFCATPFDDERGLMNEDGTPGDMFLPWRTTALALGSAEYLGSIQLPNGSPNQIFSRQDDAVMIVWNKTPTEEVLYLGENVRQIDLWGGETVPEKRGHRQVIRAGELPTFVVGLNEPIARWRKDFRFDSEQVPSITGRPHSNSFVGKNHFDRGVGGQVDLIMPKSWRVQPRRSNFRLAGGEELRRNFEVTLPFNAGSGRHDIRADFEVEAGRTYRFSVYRHINVGTGDIDVQIATRLNAKGELEVEQRFVNETGRRLNFRCQLWPNPRRLMKTQVIDLGPTPDVKVYRLENGRELLGQWFWLRASEIDGPRVLTYRFEVKE